MTDEERRATFDAAVANCVTAEHPAGCSFGGWSLRTLYWLAADGCELQHSDTCAWCGADAVTGFPGWVEGHEGKDDYRYVVPACEACGVEWARIDPRWVRAPHGS